jgi:hypothetical protein
MKKLLVLVMAVVLAAGFNSCKKYEDGPMLSFRSKKARLVNVWVIEKVMSDGVDVTSNYPEDYTLEFKDDETFLLTTNNLEFDGSWKFSDDKTNVLLTPTKTGIEEKYFIKKLKNKEFTYDYTSGTKVSTFYMVQKP